MTSKSLRWFQKDYLKHPTNAKRDKLFYATKRLAAARSIAEHCAEGLKEALSQEKKKRTRGKRLNLRGKEAKGA
jgi:hypothetical protein